ncbi:MAG: signal peptide peptidase SppA [Planctomycetes bacterium]|nr:signal peptide peptidase SppA [Planctomycetota bacterium]
MMRFLKPESFLITVGLVLSISGLMCMGSEQTEASNSSEPTQAVVAHFHLSGMLSESPVVDPFNLAAGQVMSLKTLVNRIEQASTDSEVKGVILTFDRMYLGFGQLEEVRESIDHLKATGKKVYVHAEGMNTFVYSLLCAADHLSVAPQSSVWLTGMYAESLYLKGLLDKIGIQADFIHIGDYKSAAEMLTHTEPSEPADENVNWLLDSLYGSLVDMIAQSRETTTEQIRDLINNGPYLAEQALEKKLIDAVETREEFLARIKADFEGEVRIDNRYGQKKTTQINLTNPFAFFAILVEMLKPPQQPQKDTIAVIYVEGVILPGYSQPNLFGQSSAAFSGDIRKALEIATRDSSVKAVVMRVDSPGGSAEASEVILNAARQVQAHKPLIVSMGNVAGSGGYYISCAADAIFADKVTVTASIGVVGGKLVTTDMWNKLGVNWVGYKRGANADIFNSARRFDDSQRQLLQHYMQTVYETFKGHVAKGRGNKLAKSLDEIAGGRVYTGKQAFDLGLVDHIGGLKEAIDYAVSKMSLKDYEVRVIPRPKDFFTIMMEQFSGQGQRPTDITTPDTTAMFAGTPTWKTIFEFLRNTEPQRAHALYQALQRIELIRQEGVIMMMPFDTIFHLTGIN